MANRRMFAKEIIDSDQFLDMPSSSQNLYFHLAMRADDDGFINNPKKIQRTIGASDDDAKILLLKNYIINFETGIIVIKHWRIHNYLRKDRYKTTINVDEAAKLHVKKTGEYTLEKVGIPLVDQRLTQSSLGQVRLGKDINEREGDSEIEMMLSEIDDEFLINYIHSLNTNIRSIDSYLHKIKQSIQKSDQTTLNNLLSYYQQRELQKIKQGA